MKRILMGLVAAAALLAPTAARGADGHGYFPHHGGFRPSFWAGYRPYGYRPYHGVLKNYACYPNQHTYWPGYPQNFPVPPGNPHAPAFSYWYSPSPVGPMGSEYESHEE